MKPEGTEIAQIGAAGQCTVQIYESRVSLSKQRDRDLFSSLVDKWRQERSGFSSSLSAMIACPAYLRIIAMGIRALPLIMEQLERESDAPDHWGAALQAITGEDPVPEESRGDTVGIAKAWLEWNEKYTRAFLDSTTLTVGSLVPQTFATTVLRGRPRALLLGGGPSLEDTGLKEHPGGSLSLHLLPPLEPSHMSHVEMVRLSTDTRRLQYSLDKMEFQLTQLGSSLMARGRAN